jgi:hypothetical protein
MASTTSVCRPWAALLRRWPTAFAVGAAALTLGGATSDKGVLTFAGILPLLPLLYLVVAKLGRR